MKKAKRRKTETEKLEILNYCKKHGIAKTKQEYNVSIGSIYKWQGLYEEQGLEGLSRQKKGERESLENRRLKRENDELKKLVAEKELELRIKTEMLKKST